MRVPAGVGVSGKLFHLSIKIQPPVGKNFCRVRCRPQQIALRHSLQFGWVVKYPCDRFGQSSRIVRRDEIFLVQEFRDATDGTPQAW